MEALQLLRVPRMFYTGIGYYNLSLVVATANGCTSTFAPARFIRIVDGIDTKFDFSRSSACAAPITANFTNQSSGPGIISYNWDFGDGQTSTVKNPTNIYNGTGTYNVTLNASSNLGCKSSITKPIDLGSTTSSISSITSACSNQPITFTNSSTPAPLSQTWDFGDGTSSTQANPVKTYSTPGTYTVKLLNKYAECTGTATQTITINTPPVIDFTAPRMRRVCTLPHTVNFTANAPGATTYTWNFGDGTPPFTTGSPTTSHQYTREDNFDVTLTTTSAGGCPSTIKKISFVQVKTSLSLSIQGLPFGGCVPVTINPTASVGSVDPVVSYLWDFGDGTTDNQQRLPSCMPLPERLMFH